jgi:hypothetical protein
MSEIRFVVAPLDVSFELLSNENRDLFLKEYNSMSEFEEDSVGQWLKTAKAKGETNESDQVLLTLLVELHKKIDTLTAIVKDEERKLLDLSNRSMISDIGFEHIKLEEELLEEGKDYYMRVAMPVFPKREIPIFIKALDKKVAKILKIHDKDESDWSAYVMARERVMIREAKEGKRI